VLRRKVRAQADDDIASRQRKGERLVGHDRLLIWGLAVP
jgi:hypothetical protein